MGWPRLSRRSHQAAVVADPGLPRLRASLPAPPRPPRLPYRARPHPIREAWFDPLPRDASLCANLADLLAGTERKSGWLKDSGSHFSLIEYKNSRAVARVTGGAR